ncbi:MAG: hypothetical protein AAB664_01215, partial [Patescibacteria group bacterium]
MQEVPEKSFFYKTNSFLYFMEEHNHMHEHPHAPQPPAPPQPKLQSFFDAIPSKTAFWIGCATSVLAVGTVGFIVLAGCMLTQKCAVSGLG